MDKEHLVDLISCSFYQDGESDNTRKITNEFKDYLNTLDLEQLRTMSKEFIL